jgi:hypothetical protein
LDERLRFIEVIEQRLTDSPSKNTQLPLAGLLRQSASLQSRAFHTTLIKTLEPYR